MKEYQNIIIIYEEKDKNLEEAEAFLQTLPHLTLKLQLCEKEQLLEPLKNTLYFLYLKDIYIKAFLKNNSKKRVNVALLPHEEAIYAMKRYGIDKNIPQAIQDGLNKNLRINDELLLCNKEVVFKKISIGNVQNLNQNIHSGFFSNIKNFFSNLRNLKYQTIHLKTKNNSVKKAISGVLILEDYTIYSKLNVQNKSSFHDGNLNAFLIAPYSLVSYVYYLIVIFLYHKYSFGSLPKNIGYISAPSLEISSKDSFDFSLDDVSLSSQHISIEILMGNLKIHYGNSFEEIISQAIKEKPEKNDEIIDVKTLPKGDIENLLVDGNIPIFRKVSDEDIKETLLSLNESSKTSSIFIILMILSTLLATVGLFQDSTPSVIGAMILAPLMAPIISLAMGFTRNNQSVITQSLKTLLIGIVCAVFFSATFTLLMPLEVMNAQIASRIHPNLLDLFIAIFSGIAGAYASSKEEIAKSLAGVAIAVALVPPLAVTGIGLGWGDFNIIYGSFLLFLTNFFGMILAASVTFIVLGFAPIHRAKKGLTYSTILLALVSIPLVISFYSLVLQSKDYSKLSHIKSMVINQKSIQIQIVKINHSQANKTHLEIETSSKEALNSSEYKQIHRYLEKILQKEVELTVLAKIIIK
ncbi:MAG: TIGR00341 family protein [Arcobacteraceae bacterium]